jgi:methionine-gamma-lyase
MADASSWGSQTRAIHAGESADPVTGASSPNLVMSTTYVVAPDVSFSAEDFGEDTPFVYTRWGNPTVRQLETKLAALEGAGDAIAFASGMAAIGGLFLDQLKAGDHLIMSDVAYAGASELANDALPKLGVTVSKVNLSDLDGVGRAFRPTTRLVYAETPSNPILRLSDIGALAALAHGHGAVLAVDSTFASPVSTHPLALGADFVVHSLTKYIGGHGDAIGGAVLGTKAAIGRIRQGVGIHFGGILSPFNAWLILRGVATLPLRMRAHQEGAFALARWLEGDPRIQRVIYPGLESHPQHELARRQMANFSGMLTFQTKEPGPEVARRFHQKLKVIHHAVSLGHHRSLVFYLGTDDLLRTSFPMDAAGEASYRSFAGSGVFRFSVGLEDPADLIADLDRALG